MLGVLGGIFHFYSNSNSTFSDLGLRCLPMSHKEDARFIWVKHEPMFDGN